MDAKFKSLDDIHVSGKRVILRADLNLPVANGKITDHTRLERLLPTLRELTEKNARVIVLSHFGRPKGRDMKQSLAPIAAALEQALGIDIKFVSDCIGADALAAAQTLQDGKILVCENLRFHEAEEKNDPDFAAQLAQLGEIYINDAFSVSHRAHASVYGLAQKLPRAAGRMMEAELRALASALEHPRPPVMAIAGGSKVSTKLELLNNIIPRVQKLVLGGAMANTFLFAQGKNVAASMHEKDMVETVREIMITAGKHGCEIILPTDAQLADAVKSNANIRTAQIADIQPNEMILDFGPESLARVEKILGECQTLLWNGPLGVFEVPPFDKGTVEIAKFAAAQTQAGKLTSIAGGGDTAAAMNHADVMDQFTYISTAGGAFLEWLEGKTLPGVAALAG
ncbi:MAG TPA: phosphoglycerate kinase [Rhodospirillaceae bacterium]|nr:phosphoglycerate kinase [Rhodospirillaceae bacterium]